MGNTQTILTQMKMEISFKLSTVAIDFFVFNNDLSSNGIYKILV